MVGSVSSPPMPAMSMRPPTTPPHHTMEDQQPPMETITLVHPCCSEPIEDQIIITTQATLVTYEINDMVMDNVEPGILVMDIRTGAPSDDNGDDGDDNIECITLPPSNEETVSGPLHHTTTTTPIITGIGFPSPTQDEISTSSTHDRISTSNIQDGLSTHPAQDWITPSPTQNWISTCPGQGMTTSTTQNRTAASSTNTSALQYLRFPSNEPFVSPPKASSAGLQRTFINITKVPEPQHSPERQATSVRPYSRYSKYTEDSPSSMVTSITAVSPPKTITAISAIKSSASISPTKRITAISPIKSIASTSHTKSSIVVSPTKNTASTSHTKNNTLIFPTQSNTSTSPSKNIISISPTLSNVSPSPTKNIIETPSWSSTSTSYTKTSAGISPIKNSTSSSLTQDRTSTSRALRVVSTCPTKSSVSTSPTKNSVSTSPTKSSVSNPHTLKIVLRCSPSIPVVSPPKAPSPLQSSRGKTCSGKPWNNSSPAKAPSPLQSSKGKTCSGKPWSSSVKTTTTTTTTTRSPQAQHIPERQAKVVKIKNTKPSVTPSHQAAPHHTTTTTTTKGTDRVNTKRNMDVITTCSLCKCESHNKDSFITLNLKAALPNTMLKAISLLQHCLGVSSVKGDTPVEEYIKLCKQCHSLVCEGDQAMQGLMDVSVRMRNRWPGMATKLTALPPVPVLPDTKEKQETTASAAGPLIPTHTPPQFIRRLQHILPKPSKSVNCGLCGGTMSGTKELHQHTTSHHRLIPKWKNLKLQGTLKRSVVKELRQGSGPRKARRCPTCTKTFVRLKEFVDHLRDYHRMDIDEDFLASFERDGKKKQPKNKEKVKMEEENAEHNEEEEEEVTEEIEEREEVTLVKEEVTDEEEPTKYKQRIKKEVEEVAEEKQGLEEEEEEGSEVKQRIKKEVEEVAEEKQLSKSRAANNFQEEKHSERGKGGPAVRQGQAGAGGKWRCEVCAVVFPSQHDHDHHKAAKHPGLMPSRTQSAAATAVVVKKKQMADDDGQQDTESPDVVSQEAAIVILEDDGQGGVAHRRVARPINTQDKAQLQTSSRMVDTQNFPCPSCNKVCANHLALVHHQQNAHSDPNKSVVLLECPLCRRRLASSTTLHNHMVRMHQQEPTKPPMRHQCRHCLYLCHTRTQLERHTRQRHGAPPPPPPVRCSHCGKMYSPRYIDAHIENMHSEGTRFPCSFCPMKFKGKGSLQVHVSREHANTIWKCQDCPMEYSKYYQLRDHRLYTHSTVEHRCSECPRTFKRRSDLTEHIKRRHRERKQLECHYCHKVYIDRRRLRTHLMDIHNVPWEKTLAKGYARRQRESNCLQRRRPKPKSPPTPNSPQEEEQESSSEEEKQPSRHRKEQLTENPVQEEEIGVKQGNKLRRSLKHRRDVTEHNKARHKKRRSLECCFCHKMYTNKKCLHTHLVKKHWEDNLTNDYNQGRKENNPTQRRQKEPQSPRSPLTPDLLQEEEQQSPREVIEVTRDDMTEEESPTYRVVQLSGPLAQEGEQQSPREVIEVTQDDMTEESPTYRVVQLSEPPAQPLNDAISFMILENL